MKSEREVLFSGGVSVSPNVLKAENKWSLRIFFVSNSFFVGFLKIVYPSLLKASLGSLESEPETPGAIAGKSPGGQDGDGAIGSLFRLAIS